MKKIDPAGISNGVGPILDAVMTTVIPTINNMIAEMEAIKRDLGRAPRVPAKPAPVPPKVEEQAVVESPKDLINPPAPEPETEKGSEPAPETESETDKDSEPAPKPAPKPRRRATKKK